MLFSRFHKGKKVRVIDSNKFCRGNIELLDLLVAKAGLNYLPDYYRMYGEGKVLEVVSAIRYRFRLSHRKETVYGVTVSGGRQVIAVRESGLKAGESG